MPAETYYIVKEDSVYSTPWYDIKDQYVQAYDAYNVALSQPPGRGEDPMIIERNARDQFISDCNAIALYYNSIKDTCPIPSTVNGKRSYNDGRDNFILLKDPSPIISPSIDSMPYKVPLSNRTSLRSATLNWI